jgi:hypothetical protein
MPNSAAVISSASQSVFMNAGITQAG